MIRCPRRGPERWTSVASGLATALSLLVVLLYHQFVVQPWQGPPSPVSAPQTPVTGTGSTLAQPDAAPEQPPASGEAVSDKYGKLSFDITDDQATVVVDTDLWRATLTPQGGRLASLVLKQFRQTVDRESPPLELVERGGILPLTLILGAGQNDASVVYQPSTTSLSLSGDQGGEVVFTGTTPSGLQARETHQFPGQPVLFDVDVKVRAGEAPSTIGLLLPDLEREGITTSSSSTEVAVVLSEGKLHETALDRREARGRSRTSPQPRGSLSACRSSQRPSFRRAPNGPCALVEPIGSNPSSASTTH